MQYYQALQVAQRIMELLSPAFKRIEIAGEVRLMYEYIDELELVAIPNFEYENGLTFERTLYDIIRNTSKDLCLTPLINAGRFRQYTLSLNDRVFTSAFVNLSMVTPGASWGVRYCFRTGPIEFIQWLSTPSFIGGGFPSGYYLRGGSVYSNKNDNFIPMPEEINFLNFCNLDYIEPSKRAPKWNHENARIRVSKHI
jgi:hypothetical protein